MTLELAIAIIGISWSGDIVEIDLRTRNFVRVYITIVLSIMF
jgi:hypothetical protein